MYVSYDEFAELTLGYTAPDDGSGDQPSTITEEQYVKMAPMADLIIDDWTLGRVGRAVANDEELPYSVKNLYVTIIESIPAIMDGVKPGREGLVSSFSNGIDSYSFEVTNDMRKQLNETIGWMLNLLPVEWCSTCVSFEGGNAYAG